MEQINKPIKTSKIPKNIKEKEKPKKNISNLERHKYKVENGKKVYTFKNKNDISKNLKFTNKKINKLLNGEVQDKYKISLI